MFAYVNPNLRLMGNSKGMKEGVLVNMVDNKFKEVLFTKLIKRTYSPSDNHLIFANPRGGSTWLMEIIQSITNEPVIWEPLDRRNRDKAFVELNFGGLQYIPEEEKWPEAKDIFDRLFSGQIMNHNTFRYSTIKQLLQSDSLLIKFCRGNALLPWLVSNFTFKDKPIFMIRHPLAVVASQMRHGAWDYKFNGFKVPESPYNEIYAEHEPFLTSLTTKEELLVSMWCIANKGTLDHERNNKDWLTVNYEEFVVNPEKTVERILESWGVSYHLEKISFTKNSVTTRVDSSAEVKGRLSQWQQNLDKAQIGRMMGVMEYFEIEQYSYDPMPNIIYNYG